MTTTLEFLAQARYHHQAGNLDQAEQLYRQLLQAEPQHAEALHLLGVLSSQQGRHDSAILFIQQALAVSPEVAHFHNNLGFAHQELGQWKEAATHYRQAIQPATRLRSGPRQSRCCPTKPGQSRRSGKDLTRSHPATAGQCPGSYSPGKRSGCIGDTRRSSSLPSASLASATDLC